LVNIYLAYQHHIAEESNFHTYICFPFIFL
jgi:hypothetical protein